MKPNDDFERAKSLIAQGDLMAAVELLKPVLEREKRWSKLARMLRVVEANAGVARQKALQGLLTSDEERKESAAAAHSLLQIIEFVRSGKATTEGNAAFSAQKRMQRGLLFLVGLAGLASVSLFVIWPLFKPKCPRFSEKSGLRVLILPFVNLSPGTGELDAAALLATDITLKTSKNGLSIDAKAHSKFDSKENAPDFESAERIASNCGADMAVWGQYLTKGDSVRLRLSWQFVGGERGSTGFETLSDPTFWAKGTLEKSFDDAVFSICAVMAVRGRDEALAKRWLESSKAPDGFEQNALDQLATH